MVEEQLARWVRRSTGLRSSPQLPGSSGGGHARGRGGRGVPVADRPLCRRRARWAAVVPVARPPDCPECGNRCGPRSTRRRGRSGLLRLGGGLPLLRLPGGLVPLAGLDPPLRGRRLRCPRHTRSSVQQGAARRRPGRGGDVCRGTRAASRAAVAGLGLVSGRSYGVRHGSGGRGWRPAARPQADPGGCGRPVGHPRVRAGTGRRSVSPGTTCDYADIRHNYANTPHRNDSEAGIAKARNTCNTPQILEFFVCPADAARLPAFASGPRGRRFESCQPD
jgi:hypothetical protein